MSIGVPVFNGENYLTAALDSVLAQTYADLEVIVSDNASTDGTARICREYAARDRRVRVVRNPENLGAAPNYNRTFALASGEYFKWAAHDDTLEPTCLERLVALLESNPEAALAYSPVAFIGPAGEHLGSYDSRVAGADSPRPSTRFAAMVLGSHSCMQVFGLFRRRMLVGSILHGHFHGGERALLAQVSLRGPLVAVAEPLLGIRDHPGRYTRAMSRPEARLRWHDASRQGQIDFPVWRLYAEYTRMVRREVRRRDERWRCYGHLLRWWACNWNSARAIVDPVAAIAPGALQRAERWKVRWFGQAPGDWPRPVTPEARGPGERET